MKEKIVIIGGGFAGSYAAKKLESKFNVTLIDTKDYFEFTPGILRTIVKPKHLKKIQILHEDYLKKTKIVIGKVSEVARSFVKLNGKKLNFDYLVIATGSRYCSPFKDSNVVIATRAKTLEKHYNEVSRAKKILIIGGGLVGVELAGELVSEYDDKEITIAHGADKLIQRNSEKAINYATKFLTDRGVKILYNEYVSNSSKGKYTTKNGKEISADLVFLCTGIIPNSDFMKKNFSSQIGEHGHLVVNEFFEFGGEKNIFAIGDVTNVKEEKTAQNAQRHAKLIVKNIGRLENGETPKKYVSKKSPLIISLGKWRGIFTTGNYTSCGFTPGLMKTIVEKLEIWRKKLF